RRPRPDPDPRDPRADRRARRREAGRARAHRDPLDPHPPGGGGDLPARADHQPRAQGRRPAARGAHRRRRQPRGGVRARDGARAGRGAGGVRRGGARVRHVFAIAGRELRSLFASPVAYAVLVLFAVLAGFFFLTGVLQFQDYVVRMQSFQLAEQLAELNVNDHVIAPFVHVMSVVLLFLIPGITMGLFAAEKANGTQELLLTSPITIWELVIGKFLAAAAFVTLLVLLLGRYVGLLFWYGDPEIGKTAAALGGLWLVGLTYAAIGGFASSVTQSQLIAFFLAFVLLLVLWMLGFLADLGAAGGAMSSERVAGVLRWLSSAEHFESMVMGLVDSRHVAYFAAMIAGSLIVTKAAVESVRWR